MTPKVVTTQTPTDTSPVLTSETSTYQVPTDTSTITTIITTPSPTDVSTNATTLSATANFSTGRCSAFPALCCLGLNNSCNRGCYCDQACLNFSDCCPDYKLTCAQNVSTNATTVSPTADISIDTSPVLTSETSTYQVPTDSSSTITTIITTPSPTDVLTNETTVSPTAGMSTDTSPVLTSETSTYQVPTDTSSTTTTIITTPSPTVRSVNPDRMNDPLKDAASTDYFLNEAFRRVQEFLAAKVGDQPAALQSHMGVPPEFEGTSNVEGIALQWADRVLRERGLQISVETFRDLLRARFSRSALEVSSAGPSVPEDCPLRYIASSYFRDIYIPGANW
ncbi:salivary glue protein Sgs-3-like [Hoplias malabaricus]|uniref:salivary glue protein Sgs-3-like n=1 Tax=Hoplias malabaricus TaxID=27720 RepID=UPI003463279D